MMYSIISKDAGWVMDLTKKARQLFTAIHNFKETHKSLFMKCAVIFMSVKIGIILLATVSTMAFFLISVTPYLTGEISRVKVLLFASSLTMIIMLKLYFVCKVLITYDRSRAIMITVFKVLLLKGKQGLRQIGEAIPADLSPLSLEKVRNR